MAKELPYFRFTPQEWQNGDIGIEPFDVKGLFIDVCAFYWVRDCSVTTAMLDKRYSHAKELLDQLYKSGIISNTENSDFVSISFLNEQYDMLSTKRKLRQEAGRAGGLAKSSNAKAMLKQKPSNALAIKIKIKKDKDNDKEHLVEDKSSQRVRDIISFCFESWNDLAKTKPHIAPKRKINEATKKKMRSRIKEHPENTEWVDLFQKIMQSKVLGELDDMSWFTFDWIFHAPGNYDKIMAGWVDFKADNGKPKRNSRGVVEEGRTFTDSELAAIERQAIAENPKEG